MQAAVGIDLKTPCLLITKLHFQLNFLVFDFKNVSFAVLIPRYHKIADDLVDDILLVNVVIDFVPRIASLLVEYALIVFGLK